MKERKSIFKHSIYGLISGLILLVPIFPILTFLPINSLAEVLGNAFSDCVIGWKTTYWFSLILTIIVDFLYFRRIVRKNITKKCGFGLSVCFNLFLYSLVNAFIFVTFIGLQAACYSKDGQLMFPLMYSGPISSIVVFVNGLLIDLVRYMLKTSKIKE